MTRKEINQMYMQRFIASLENDFQNWEMMHCGGGGPGYYWTEYHSPSYENENGRVSFGFSLSHEGAWVDGTFNWSVPFLNPFSKTFWRYRKATSEMKKWLQDKEEQEYLQKLNKIIS
jgi:hypothetical protein